MTLLAFEAKFEDGVMRWQSSGRVPPEEWVEKAILEGYPVDKAKCDAVRSAELKEFFAAYRKAREERTPEQIAEERMEARAAMGAGVEMVNIVTGEKFTT